MSFTAWIAPVSPDLVWVDGVDATRFLNDLISQEIADMAPHEVRRSFLLDPQGKLDHLLWVVQDEDRLGLITDDGRGEDLVTALARYRIRVDVQIEIESRPTWLVVGDWDGIDLSWDSTPRYLVIGDHLELPNGSMEKYESLRVAEGEPLWGAEVSGSTIPHETGLVSLSVDFDKGCYLGQELVARVDSRGGNVPRFVRLIDMAGHAGPGATLTVDGSDVGTLTSVADLLALGVVHRSVAPGDTVSIGPTTGVVREITRNPQT